MKGTHEGGAVRAIRWAVELLQRVSLPGLIFTACTFLLLTLLPWMPLNPLAVSRFEAVPGGGIRMAKPSLFRSDWAPPFARSSALSQAQLSVEFDVLPELFDQEESSRIFSYSADEANPIFVVSQRRADLMLGYKNHSNYLEGLFESHVRHHYLLVLERDRSQVYVDGALRLSQSITGKDIAWGEGFVSVGNEITGDRPFVGNIYRLRVFDRALTQEEAMGLHRGEVPSQVSYLTLRHAASQQKLWFEGSGLADMPLEREAWPFIWKWRLPLPEPVTQAQYWLDVVLNLIATMPVGVWGVAWLLGRGRAFWEGLVAAAGLQLVLSVVAEGSQFFSMGFRFASVLDVLVNVSGAVLGAVFWLGVTRGLARFERTHTRR